MAHGPIAVDIDALVDWMDKSGKPRLAVRARVCASQLLRAEGRVEDAATRIEEADALLRAHSVEATFPLRVLLERAQVAELRGELTEAERVRKMARRRLELVARRVRRSERPRFRRANAVRRALS